MSDLNTGVVSVLDQAIAMREQMAADLAAARGEAAFWKHQHDTKEGLLIEKARRLEHDRDAARAQVTELTRERDELLRLLHERGNSAQTQVLNLTRENLEHQREIERLQGLLSSAADEGLASGYVQVDSDR